MGHIDVVNNRAFYWLLIGMLQLCAKASAETHHALVTTLPATVTHDKDPLLSPVDISAVFVIAPGQSRTFKLKDPIEGIDIPNRAVCNVRLVGSDGLVLTGLKLGKTQFTVWGTKSGIATFTVDVVPDRRTVCAELLQKYPKSNLQLIPSLESEKVIVKGTLPSTAAVHDVLEHLIGPDLSRSQIINSLAIPCCNGPCYPIKQGLVWRRR